MLTGKEKAQILLSQVGKNATKVLDALSQESASLLTASIDDTPKPDQQEMVILSKEIMEKLQQGSDSLSNTEVSNIDEVSFDTIDIDEANDNVLQTDILNETPAEEAAPETIVNEEASINTDEPELSSQDHSNTEQGNGPNPKKLAYVLSKQKPQIVAYFLSRYDENLRSATVSFLPENIQSIVQNLQVSQIPLSDSVFQRLNASILKEIDLVEDHEIASMRKEEEVAEQEQRSSDDLFNSDSSFDDVISFD